MTIDSEFGMVQYMVQYKELGMVQYKKMPPAKKKAWIADLRSGDFKQAPDTLCMAPDTHEDVKQEKYCCLGVACVTFGETWVKRRWGKGKYGTVRWGLAGNSIEANGEGWAVTDTPATDMPSKVALKRWGLDPDAARVLATMNDNGKSFKQIANWIEKNL